MPEPDSFVNQLESTFDMENLSIAGIAGSLLTYEHNPLNDALDAESLFDQIDDNHEDCQNFFIDRK